jgi:hypothetical protein
VGDGGWECAGEVSAAVGPVDATAGQDAPCALQRFGVEAEVVEPVAATVGELVIALVDRVDRAVGEQAVAQLYAEPSGEVVIADAGLGKRASGAGSRLKRSPEFGQNARLSL